MKRGRRVRVFNLKDRGRIPALIVLSGCFLCGIFAGCLWADSVTERGGAVLSEYINGYLTVLRGGTAGNGSLLATLWELFRWPLLTVAFAFTAVGLIAIPVIFLLRGFLLSFSIACLIRVLGSTGAILAFFLFGISGVLSLPVLFILGIQGITACRQLCLRLMGTRQNTEPIYGNEYLIRCGFCAVILCICVCLEQFLLPALLTVLVGTF